MQPDTSVEMFLTRFAEGQSIGPRLDDRQTARLRIAAQNLTNERLRGILQTRIDRGNPNHHTLVAFILEELDTISNDLYGRLVRDFIHPLHDRDVLLALNDHGPLIERLNNWGNTKLAATLTTPARDYSANRWVLRQLRDGPDRFTDLVTTIFQRTIRDNESDRKVTAAGLVFEERNPDDDPQKLYEVFYRDLDSSEWIVASFDLTARHYNQPPPADLMEQMPGEQYDSIVEAIESHLNKRQRSFLHNLR